MLFKKTKKSFAALVGLSLLAGNAASLADDKKPAAGSQKPVKVFILSGQSNMVGFGKVTNGSMRWGSEMVDPVLSVYEGAYDSSKDYSKETPIKKLKLEAFGGGTPTPFLEGGTQVVRGKVKVKLPGTYQFKPGYGTAEENIMTVNGTEVSRKEPGQPVVRQTIDLVAGEEVPFEIIYLNGKGNGLGWVIHLDPPDGLARVVRDKGLYPFLVDEEKNWKARDDVWFTDVFTGGGSGWLDIIYRNIGPEIGFGHRVGDLIDQPVLLIKSSQGNRSLGWDFLPPGSERYPYKGKIYAGYKDSPQSWVEGSTPEKTEFYGGRQYDDCFSRVHETLAKFDEKFPHWKGRGYEIEGFVWWQGDKDRYVTAHALRYEKNLVNLINTLRKES